MMKHFYHDLLSREDDKIWELIDRHGLTGYGAWWVVVEELYKAESKGFQVEATEVWVKRLSKDLQITDYRTLPRFLDAFAEIGLIDAQLWADHVIFSYAVVSRGDRYVQKKIANAERKAKEREKWRQEREAGTRNGTVDVTRDSGVTDQKSEDVTRDSLKAKAKAKSDLDLSNINNLDRYSDAETRNNGARSSRKKGKKKSSPNGDPYAAIADLERFELFWFWYRTKICGISGAKPGNKADAAIAWAKLETNNFHGVGIEGFREGCNECLKQSITAKGIGTRHACRFLSGGESGSPEWLTVLQDKAIVLDSDFLEGVDIASDLESVRKAIGVELDRLKVSAVLPDLWQQKTGVHLVRLLALPDAIEYLQYLKGLDHATAS